MGRAALRVRLLGTFEVEGIETSTFGSRKGRTLLKRLALDAGTPLSVDALVDLLWPSGVAPTRPADQVSVLVSRLRRALGQDSIAHADGSYTLHADWIDIGELRNRVAEAERRLADGSVALARAAAAAALALVRGPLLADDIDEPWTESSRASVDRVVMRARHIAAEAALASGFAAEAAEHASVALVANPYDEVALRLLMKAHVASGRSALALSAYAETAALVAEELGADLDPLTQELHLAVLRGDAMTAPRTPPTPNDRLIGRAKELTALDDAFGRAVAGTAVVVVIEGEAGIGKSRLLSAFAGRVTPAAQVLRASADTAGVLPMEPILDALGRRLASSSESERAVFLGADADLLDPLLRPGAGVGPTPHRELLVAHEPGDESAPAVLLLALLAVVARLCAQRPVVLLLDDAHLADAATVSWLGLVARHGARMPLLAVAARRPPARAVPGAETIVLDRLSPEAAAAVVAPYVDPARLDAVVNRSAGLPLFLVELAHATGETLPDSIRDAVLARVADAGDVATTLRAAAVLGVEVDVDLLAGVLEQQTPLLLDHLEEAARRRFLDDAPGGYVFHHDLIREALEIDTPSARRAWLHRQAAAVLARRMPIEHLAVAHHARLGGDKTVAAHSLCAAAEQAGSRFDHEAALALAEESMRLVDSAKAHVVRGRSFVLLRRYAEAREAVERARALGAGASVLEVAAFAAYYARDLDAALRLADEAASGSDDPEVLDACGYLAAKVLHTRGQITDAEKRLAPMAESPGRSQVAAFAGIWRSLVHLHRGHVDAAGIDLAGSDSARLARIPYAPLYVDQFTAHLAGLDGRPVEALTVAERLRAAATEQRALRFFGRAEVYRGWALSILGDPSAVDALEEAREVARSAGNPEPLGQGSLDLATVHLDHGRLEAAEAALYDVDEVIAAGGQVSNGWRIRLRAHYLRGRLALAHRDTDAAAEAAAGVIARARLDNIDRYDVLGSLLRIEATATAGEPVDVGDVEPYLPRLLAVAQPEAWRITARLGHVLGAERLLVWSSDRIAELIRRNAPYSEQIRADAARVLSSGR